MKIIRKAPNPSGGYPSPQDWPDGVMIPEEMAVWPDTLDTADFFAHNGFAVLTIEQVEGVDTVVSYAPNTEAWEAWKAEQTEIAEPEPEPTLEDRVAGLESAIERGLAL